MQLPLFEELAVHTDARQARSGTFLDNMSLPVHRWFRYSAGFSAEWVEQVLTNWQMRPGNIILDPFAGSGTVSLACEKRAITSIAVEAHPVVARICQSKLSWHASLQDFKEFSRQVVSHSKMIEQDQLDYPDLILRSYDLDILRRLDALKRSWLLHADQSLESELTWLAITAILRPCSKAGTAQWQYILPNKSKKNVQHPDKAIQDQVTMMCADMEWMQDTVKEPHSKVIFGDARRCSETITETIDAVVTSPPYANNYDYADALRFEMTFWGEVSGWGDIHDKVRKHLIVSSSQHSSKERLKTEDLLASPLVQPILSELTRVVRDLTEVREDHGGKKHYHTMIPAYCRDIALVLQNLRKICKPGAQMCWVVGDSAPYGVYCPIDEWIGQLALAAGFTSYRFEKMRDRNIKWKNRKHRVPLKEGMLWIEG